MMLDLLGDSGSVTAVDVSRHRLAACRTMLRKYESGDRCRLFVADGTTFSLVPIRDHTDSRSCNLSANFLSSKVQFCGCCEIVFPVFDALSFLLESCR